jgi:hypothetical protein
MQYEQGKPVPDRADLIPGDLVFFETYAKGASHVGIYIGDSQYIQCGGSTGVTIQSFDPGHAEYSPELDRATWAPAASSSRNWGKSRHEEAPRLAPVAAPGGFHCSPASLSLPCSRCGSAALRLAYRPLPLSA